MPYLENTNTSSQGNFFKFPGLEVFEFSITTSEESLQILDVYYSNICDLWV